MGKRLVAAGSAATALVAALVVAVPPARATAVFDQAASFTVINKNDSKFPCSSDGHTYHLAGRLIAPSPPQSPTARGVTLYVHGSGGSAPWHLQGVADYADYATQMALAGHTSMIVDLLGYGASGLPDGNQTCFGSDADVLSQVIADLRSGSYTVGGRPGPTFAHIALAGHSAGGLRVQVEAYSFGGVDALLIMGIADQISNAGIAVTVPYARATEQCLSGGQSKYDTKPSPGGYAYVFHLPQESDTVFFNAEDTVINALAPRYERDPCGDINSSGEAWVNDEAYVPTITVPVLVVCGDHDVESPQDCFDQLTRYMGSRDKSLAIIPDSGHMVQLQRTAPTFRQVVSNWLTARGF